MWNYIRNLVREENLSVILTTHYMEEAERLCNRVGIIDRGRIIALDSPDNLKLMIGGDVVEIKVKGRPIGDYSDPRIRSLGSLGFVRKVTFTDGLISLPVNDAGRNIPDILKIIDAEHVTFRSPNLNDVFLKMTGRTMHEQQAEGGFVWICGEVYAIWKQVG